MAHERIVRIHSISKKLLVGLFASFLVVFLFFHMSANLLILLHDDGAAYTAFCHFMGTNPLVKVAEVALFGSFFIHIVLASYLWFCNRRKRPVGYHKRSRTRTAAASKLAMITGSLLLICLVFHLYDFYLVKLNVVDGLYMVKLEELNNSDINEDAIWAADEEGEYKEFTETGLKWFELTSNPNSDVWLNNLTKEDTEILQQVYRNINTEPDFYHMAWEKFSKWHIVLCYLLFFALVGIHIRHGFESLFQTFGLNNRRYAPVIKWCGIIYTWIICLGFSTVTLGVFFGL